MAKVGPDHTDSTTSTSSTATDPSTSSATPAAHKPGTSPAGRGWTATWFRQQKGVTRYNCADSLDRTNVGSFFGAVQVGG